MDLESLGPPASTRRTEGCEALRDSREARVAPAGPANVVIAQYLLTHKVAKSSCNMNSPPTMMISYDFVVGLFISKVTFEREEELRTTLFKMIRLR